MEVTDNPRPKTTNSDSPNPNPQLQDAINDPSKLREEGELSSEDEHMLSLLREDQVLTSSQGNSVDGATGLVPVLPANKFSEDVQVGKNGNNPTSAIEIQSQARTQPISQKGFDKNRIPSKPNILGRCSPVGTSNNLVIRFSDDSSGSDSEERIKEKATENNSNKTGVAAIRKPPAPLVSNLNKQSSTTISKVIPQRFTFNRAFTSTMTKMLGSNPSGGKTLSVEQGSRTKNFNTLTKNMPNRERGPERNVDLNITKLQDLRQQIALRESKLKSKSVQRSKESVPLRDGNATTLQSSATTRFSARPLISARVEPKEPESKRQKVSGSYSAQPNSFSSQEALAGTSVLPSKESARKKNIVPVTVSIDQGTKGKSTGRTESSIDKQKQDEKQVANVSKNLHPGSDYGGNVKTNYMQSDGNSSAILSLATSPANASSQVSPMHLNVVDPGQNQQPSSFPNTGILGKELVRGSHPGIISNHTMPEPLLSNICQESESLWNCLSNASVSEYRSMNMQSLADMEESLDKDLEEAQDLRRKCEIEERNALKAYRKAQRALVEANAKCADLYHKREMYSAQLRSIMMQNEKVRIGYSNDVTRNMLLLPSNHELQPEFDGINQVGSNFQHPNRAPVQKSYQNVNGETVGSEPCSEPDASTSEPLSQRGKVSADGFRSPSNDPNISADEDESFSFENETVQRSLEYQPKNNTLDDGEKNLSKKPSRQLIVEKSQDSLLLEATLRSELVARIGTKRSLMNSDYSDNINLTFEQRTENDVSNEKTHTNLESCLLSKAESEGGGTDGLEQSNSEALVEMQDDCSLEADCLNSHALVDPGNHRVSEKEGACILISDVSTSNIFRSAFNHLKIISSKSMMECVSKPRQNYTSDIYDKLGASIDFDEFKCCNPWEESTCGNNVELFGRREGSYTSDVVIDPFWPLCMYELRGKCNNDECSWQHIRENKAIMSSDRHGDSGGDAKAPRYSDLMVPPTYLVGLDTLKIDVPSYESVLAQRNNGEDWQKCYSLSLTPSSLFQTDLPLHGRPSYGSYGRIEVNSIWSRQSSYFLRSDRLVSNQLKQSVADNEQALETAVLTFSQEVDKHEGMKKALPFVSRTLEDNPTSVLLWMFYLIIYHCNVKSVVADDMFSCAVKYNEGSYELWLMYINSQMHLDGRLLTYDAALRSLCRHALAVNQDRIHSSACILDLFLQMIECLCMSGNVEKAIQKVVELCSADTNSDNPPLLLDELHSYLTISDKCILWVCCVYLVIYRKLPDVVVQQLECDKQLPEIEWSSIVLLDDAKQKAVELMEKGADYIATLMQVESIKGDSDRSSAQFLAVNHIRCMAAVGSIECCWTLLCKYLRLFPSCLELVLMSTRSHKQDFGDVSFLGFEEALNSWPKDISGSQCIWNQYAQLALQNGLYEYGKELMDRWYISAWKANELQDGSSSDSASDSSLSLDQVDAVFGFLNLSLYKLLQNDRIGARIAIDKALKMAIPKYLKYCIREHVMFFLTDESLMKENASIGGIVNILKHHISDSRVFSVPNPLPRKLFSDIKRPRVQQLISNVFSPVTPNFSLVNFVLEVWFGPSLLPEEFKESKHLVDFVEPILDSWPSNYVLALSVCKLLTSRNNSTNPIATMGLLFWASSNLVTAIFHTVPIPPESIWVEASRVLGKVMRADDISQRFYRRALTAYPFSVNLWRSYRTFFVKTGRDSKTITEEAKAKGIELG